MSEDFSTGKPVQRSFWAVRKWAFILVTVIALSSLLLFDTRALLRDVLARVEGLGPWAPVMFVFIYVLCTVLFVPGSALTLSAGLLFGVVEGSLLVSLSSMVGATLAFLAGRHLARDWVAKKIEGNATFTGIDRAVAEEGWKIVALTRLSPVFPFSLLNYAFGLTRVKLRDYILASWIGMIPGTVMYVYLGSLARAGEEARQRTTAEWVLYGIGLLATLAITVVITRIARRALARKTQQGGRRE